MSEKFRKDVNGLRALAVIPVLFFHAGHPWFSGGFLGVDVFFVISGYLITNQIHVNLKFGKFSFLNFYDRRARRILPALLLVLMLTAFAAPFFMVPYDLKNFGQSLVANALSANNILLYLTSGYWSLAAEFKPLYHTWSLAVEEQYYIFAPLVMYLCYKIYASNRSIAVFMLLTAAVSFVFCLNTPNREFNFLMIFSRAWEFFAGGLLALWLSFAQKRNNNVLALFGILLVACSYYNPYLFSHNQAIVSALPVVGAVLFLAYSDDVNTDIGKLLSGRPVVLLGLISYSIYLWHQPLLAFLRLASEHEPSVNIQLMVSLSSIPLAYLSWRFVEIPCRVNYIRAKNFYVVLMIVLASVLGAGWLMHKTYGMQRFWPEYSYGGDPQSYVDAPKSFQAADFSNNGKPKLLVMGNSFARDFINMLRENGLIENLDLVYQEGGCHGAQLDAILPKSEYVVYSENWGQAGFSEESLESLAACAHRIEKTAVNGKVFILGVKNFGWNNNFVKLTSHAEIIGYTVYPLESVRYFNQLAKNRIPNYVDLLDVISTQGKVRIFDNYGAFLTYDTNHLTRSGAKYVGDLLFDGGPLLALKTVAVRGL